MRVFGKPEYLNLYYRYFVPLLKGVNINTWDLSLHFLPPEEMSSGMQGVTRDRFVPPGDAYISIPEIPGVPLDKLFNSKAPLIAHEIGHYIHTAFMGVNGSAKWYRFADLTDVSLDFDWQTIDYGKARHPYPYIPAYEEFADDFRDWLQGKRVEMEAFYMGLWGQQAKVTAKDIEIFRGILRDTGEEGARKLKEELERDNPRALVYL